MDKNKILFAAELSKWVYDKEKKIPFDTLGLTLAKFVSNKKTDTQLFIAHKENDIYVVFRGTSSFRDFLTDTNVVKVPFVNGSKVHKGFAEAFRSVSHDIFVTTNKLVKPLGGWDKVNIHVCGHSLGGALATLCALVFANSYKAQVCAYTIGSPRVGDQKFKTEFNILVKEHYRIVHDKDVVPRVPKLLYFHTKGLIRLNNNGEEMKWNFLDNIIYPLKSLFSGEAILDHKAENYLKVIKKWNKEII